RLRVLRVRLSWGIRRRVPQPVKRIVRATSTRIRRMWSSKGALGRLFVPPSPFWRVFSSAGTYVMENNSHVTLYTDRTDLFPRYQPRKTLSGQQKQRVFVSLIATVRNEKENARRWLESLANQTRLPDEVVIVDGGSSDGTLQVLHEAVQTALFNLKIIEAGGVNIAKGKNIGIQHTRYPIIVHTDFGCDIDNLQWLEKLTAPFEIDQNVEVVAGWYEPLSKTALGKVCALQL